MALRKPGDSDDQDDPLLDFLRKLRPIGVCGILLNLIGTVACKQFASIFAGIFDPEPTGDFSPFNGGVAAEAGATQIKHSAVELLAHHPEWGCLQIDANAAFQYCSRAVFLRRIKEKAPGAYRWAKRCYAQARPRYVRMEDGSVQVIWSTSGTSQGDPFGPADHNFTIDELIKQIGSIIDAALLYYLDDGTIVGPVEELARFISFITDDDDSEADVSYNFETRTGMTLNISKCVMWTLASAFPAGDTPLFADEAEIAGILGAGVLDAAAQRQHAASERERLRTLFPARVHGMRGLREPRARATDPDGWAADALASQGIYLLGSPVVGTREFVSAKLEETIDGTRQLIAKARSVLLPCDGQHYPEEYLALCRNILPGRFQHHLNAVSHPVLEAKAAEFDALLLDAPSVVIGQLDSVHLDAPAVWRLGPAWGGRGGGSRMTEMRHSHLQGAWAQSHAKIARRLRVVRESQPLDSSVPAGSDLFSWHEREPAAAEAANLETASGQLGLPLRSSFGLGLRSAIEQARGATAAAWDASLDVFVNNAQQLSHLRLTILWVLLCHGFLHDSWGRVM